jgi:hypothetical protein
MLLYRAQDTLKMLGGEPWPLMIEDALNRSGHLLDLMSVHSFDKDLRIKAQSKFYTQLLLGNP